VKYEEVYLKAYSGGREARAGLDACFHSYNNQRPHQALGYRTPAEVFNGGLAPSDERPVNGKWTPGRAWADPGKSAGLSLDFAPYLSIPKPYQKPYPPMLLPVDSSESFVPMGTKGYKIAIGAGSSTHNLRGTTVQLEDVKSYRKAWKDAGHEGEPTTVVRIPTLLADTKEEAERLSDELMVLARRYFNGRIGIGSTDAGSASPDTTEEVNLFGTAEDVVEKIEVLREQYDTDEIMFEVNWTSSVPRDVVTNTIRILSDKVIPKFK